MYYVPLWLKIPIIVLIIGYAILIVKLVYQIIKEILNK